MRWFEKNNSSHTQTVANQSSSQIRNDQQLVRIQSKELKSVIKDPNSGKVTQAVHSLEGTFQKNCVRFLNHKAVQVDKIDEQNREKVHMELHKTYYYSRSPLTTQPKLNRRPRLNTARRPAFPSRRRAPLTLRNVLLDRTLNVANLAIGEFQEIHLEPNDSLFLPALKTISWHAESNDTNYSDIDSSEDDDEDPDQGCVCFALRPEHHHQHQEAFDYKKKQAVYQILRAAPNLEIIKDFHFEKDWDVVLAAGKVHCIQQLSLFDTLNVSNLLEFMEVGRLTQLKVLQLINHPTNDHELVLHPEEKYQMSLAIEKLFNLTSPTLEVLDLTQFCSSVDIQIPPLPNLRQLSVGSVRGEPQHPSRCLPRDIDLGKIFPNLKILDCSGIQCEQDSNLELYFPTIHPFQGTFDSVKLLVMPDECSQVWMAVFKTMCPNFDRLILHSAYGGGGNNINFMLRKIFRYWQHLEEIEVRLDDFPAIQELECSLDSALTGWTEESCKRLRMTGAGSGELSEEAKNVEKTLKVNRSFIGCLKELKVFRLILEHDCLGKLATRLPGVFEEETGENDPPPLLTSISCRYGFSLLRGLRMGLVFDHNCPWGKEIKKNLEALSCEFISLRNEEDECCNFLDHHDKHESEASGRIGVRIYSIY